MRISDWSSDVCSSDLTELAEGPSRRAPHHASVLRDAISTSSMAPQDERNPKHSPSLRRNRQRRAMLIRPALAARGKPVAESAADDVEGRGEEDRKSTRLNSSH